MNERIQELAYKADKDCVDAKQNEAWQWEKRFAELIIQECLAQVREQYLPIIKNTTMMKDAIWKSYVSCGIDSIVAIKEHFGGKS